MFTDNGDNVHFLSRVQDGIDLKNILFTVESVLKKIKNFNPNSFSGPDGIHNLIRKPLSQDPKHSYLNIFFMLQKFQTHGAMEI